MNKEVTAKLRRFLDASRVVEDETELLVYECDGLPLFKHRPDIVVFPKTTEDVAQIVRIANEYRFHGDRQRPAGLRGASKLLCQQQSAGKRDQ